MAVKKPTTTSDLKDGEAPDVSRDVITDSVSDLTDPAMVAEVEQPKTVTVRSPMGFQSEVPQSIVDALLDSGYTKGK